jgi:oxygen-dependent protoporphyrinogen oxidase
VIYEHAISIDAAPAGAGVIGLMLHHDWATARLERSDDKLLAEILEDLERIMPGVREQVQFAEVNRWCPVAVSARPGMQRAIADLDRAIDPESRVQLAGDYLTIPGLEGSTVSGEAAAARLAVAIDAPLVAV